MTGGFHVDLAALQQAAEGVTGTLEHLSYRKVQDIGSAASDIGHDRLAATLHDFCDRWQLGVSNLTKDCQEIASRLTESVMTYANTDQHNADLFGQGESQSG